MPPNCDDAIRARLRAWRISDDVEFECRVALRMAGQCSRPALADVEAVAVAWKRTAPAVPILAFVRAHPARQLVLL